MLIYKTCPACGGERFNDKIFECDTCGQNFASFADRELSLVLLPEDYYTEALYSRRINILTKPLLARPQRKPPRAGQVRSKWITRLSLEPGRGLTGAGRLGRYAGQGSGVRYFQAGAPGSLP